MHVKEVMEVKFPRLTPNQPIESALKVLADWGISAAPVVDRNRYVATLIIDAHVCTSIINRQNVSYQPLVRDLMNTEIPVAQEEQRLEDISLSKYPIIPVVNRDGYICGVLWHHKIANMKMEYSSNSFTDIDTIHYDELHTLIRSSHDGILITDGEGIILRMNRAEETLLGLSSLELVGKNVRELINLGIVVRSATEETIRTLKPVTIKQTTATGKDYIASATPIIGPNGTIHRVITIARDITEIMTLQEELAHTKVEALEFSSDQALIRSQTMHINGIITKSPSMLKIIDLALRVAQFDTTILISGESGVGKELIAKLIFNNSERRKSGQLIKVNCGAIPHELLESEFFGYEPGAFTGAKKEGKPGYFELADKGILFLDEIRELPLDLQVKLLRVVQEREIARLGDTKHRKVDVRIVAATNRELQRMVIEGTFREDLFYRLNVLPIQIPPLRSRPEDIPALLTAFLEKYCRKYGTGKMFSGDSLTLLSKYHWPGNVRELENIVERLVITADGYIILPQHLSIQILQVEEPRVQSDIIRQNFIPPSVISEKKLAHQSGTEMRPLQEVIDEIEKEMIIKALQIYGSTYRAAKILGISQSTMARKDKKYHQKNERFWHDDTDN